MDEKFVEEAKMALTGVFTGKGSITLSKNEIVMYISYSRGWLKAKEAEKFFENCVNAGLLITKDGSTYTPAFDIKEVDYDIGFEPDREILLSDIEPESSEGPGAMEGPQVDTDTDMPGPGDDTGIAAETEAPVQVKNVLGSMMDYIARNTGMQKTEIGKKITGYNNELQLISEASALLVGMEANLDMTSFAPDVKKTIIKKAAK